MRVEHRAFISLIALQSRCGPSAVMARQFLELLIYLALILLVLTTPSQSIVSPSHSGWSWGPSRSSSGWVWPRSVPWPTQWTVHHQHWHFDGDWRPSPPQEPPPPCPSGVPPPAVLPPAPGPLPQPPTLPTLEPANPPSSPPPGSAERDETLGMGQVCECGVSAFPPAKVPTYPLKPGRSRPRSTAVASREVNPSTEPERVPEEEEHDDRVVGGVLAAPHQFPWLALLALQQSPSDPALPWCGAALVSALHLVTAAHCVHKIPVTQLKVVLGLHDRCKSDSTSSVISVAAAEVHAGFEPKLLANDIALLTLSMRISFGRRVMPVCMPRPGAMYWGRLGEVAGWGKTQYGSQNQGSCLLLRAALPVLSRATCAESRYRLRQITRTHFCAGDIDKGGVDACQGDSGGPLMVARGADSRYELVGVVSGGQGCAQQGYPGLYTRVVEFVPWIVNRTRDAPVCTRQLLPAVA